jgi:hypothetical protein
VPAGFAQDCRRPIALIARGFAVWLVVLQAFLAGIATAQTGTRFAAVPGDVICHGAGGAGLADGSAPGTGDDTGDGWHLCCTACAASALAVPVAPTHAVVARAGAFRQLALPGFTLVAARGLIRAGPSQGPPTLV